jgi:hypothetical protein
MTLKLHGRFDGAHGLIEMECMDGSCDGRMLVDRDLARRLEIPCPVPECGDVVTVA